MKIGIVSPYNMFRSGGVQSAIWSYQKELGELGHDVYVIAPRPTRRPAKLSPKVILIGRSRSINTPIHTMVDASFNFDPRKLDAVLAEHQFDILHFHEPLVPLLPMQLLARSSAINVATLHAKMPESLFGSSLRAASAPIARTGLKKLHYLTAVSTVAAEDTGRITKLPVEIIPNGIDVADYKAYARPERANNLVFVGRLEKRKGLLHLLKAYALLRQQMEDPPKLQIIGEGKQQKAAESCIKELEIEGVTFLGAVDDKTKRACLGKAKLACFPALFGESFGIVLLEAMAAGTPVIAGNNPGYSSVMQGLGEISLVDPRQHQQLARRLQLFLEDDELRQVWLAWAARTIKNYDYKLLAKRYEAIYEKLLSKHGHQ